MTIHQKKLPKSSSWGRKPNFLSSIKNNQLCWADSILERKAFLWAEFNPLIVNYMPQPSSFIPVYEGKQRRYTPDILLQYFDGSYILKEIKPDHQAKRPKFLEYFQYLQWYVNKEHGTKLLLWTESDICSEQKGKNLERLYYYRRVSNPKNLSRRSIVRGLGYSFYFGELRDFLENKGHRYSMAFEFVAWQFLNFDLERELDRDSEMEVYS